MVVHTFIHLDIHKGNGARERAHEIVLIVVAQDRDSCRFAPSSFVSAQVFPAYDYVGTNVPTLVECSLRVA